MSLREVDVRNANGRENIPRDELYSEIGASQGASDYAVLDQVDIPELMGSQKIATYEKMRRDGSVRTSLRVVKTPLLAGEWYVEAPKDPTALELEATDFVDACLNNMSRTPLQVLWEALLCLDFGYYAFEKVFKTALWRPPRELAREKEVVIWRKWAPRHPRNTMGWVFDEHGGVQAMKHNRKPDGFDEVLLPIRRLLIFTLDEEAGNPEGFSLLRSSYAHWYYKTNLYKIDAIQKERHGIGIPDIVLPPNPTTSDKNFAREMGRNLRTNEKAMIIRPQGFEIGFAEPKGNQVDALESARHHDLMIKANVLAQFLNLGTTESGTRAVGNVQEDIFTKSIKYIGDLVTSVINKWAIPELVKYNFDVTRFPEVRVRRLGDTTELRALSITLRNLVESGLITPDGETERWLRQTHDFPAPSPEALGRGVDDRIKPAGDFTNRVTKPTDG